MRAEQISIFLQNESGRLAEVTEVLSGAGINIRALSLADTADYGVLRMIVNDNEKAEQALRDRGFTVTKTNVIAVEVPDEPGGLHRILDTLRKGGVNVEYMYAFVQQSGSNAVMIFRFNNTDNALKLLQENGISVIEGHRLYKL